MHVSAGRRTVRGSTDGALRKAQKGMRLTFEFRPLVIALTAVSCLASAGPAPAQQGKDTAAPKPSSDLSFTTHLDRTAVWIGDQFHYQVLVEHLPKIQFILENVNKDAINLDPLRV